MRRLALGLATLGVLVACSSDDASDSGTGAGAAPDGALARVCATSEADRVTTDTSGGALAARIREHQLSDEEIQLLAADLSYLLVARETGVVSPWYVRLDLGTYLFELRRRSYPSLYGACATSSKLVAGGSDSVARQAAAPETSLRPLSGTSSNCAPPAAALFDCIEGAVEIFVGEALKKIPLAKFQQWVGSMDEVVAKAHALTPELVPAVKSAVPPLEESKDILEILSRSIAQAQVVAAAAALVGLPSEPAIPVLALAGTAVSALKCARALSTAKRIVDACLAEEDKATPPSSSGSAPPPSLSCYDAGGSGVISQCEKPGYTNQAACDDGSVPSGCIKSDGYGVNGGILCCSLPMRR